jgi:hypothetical protein
MMEEIDQRERWAFAGIRDESGRLDRPTASNVLYVPAIVELKSGGRLLWVHQKDKYKVTIDEGVRSVDSFCTHPPRAVPPGPTLLEEFVRLADGPDMAIANYARKWGVLGICRHGLPRTHRRTAVGTHSDCNLLLYESDSNFPDQMGWEPLEAWRDFALKAQSILDVAAVLYEGGVVEDEKVACGFEDVFPVEKHLPFERRRRIQMDSLSVEINAWLAVGDVRCLISPNGLKGLSVTFGSARWSWAPSERKIRMFNNVDCQGTTLFGALGVQLLMAASRQRGLAVCAECGKQYSPSRRPDPNRNSYCADCGINAAQRAASRRYRARVKRKRKS